MDEFERIARHFRPLTFGAAEALDLLDDAAVIAARPGFDLIVTQDAIVQGVHCLSDDAPDLIARKLVRVNLSDLAGKAAEPDGALLTVAFPAGWDDGARAAFAHGLGRDLQTFGLRLFGGDTVATEGPFTASLTLLGWVPAGCMVRRGTARAGDVLLISGTLGDGALGLQAARGELAELGAEAVEWLAHRYRLPDPRLALRPILRAHATAAADVSDGLLADAGKVASASGLGVALQLEQAPLSSPAAAWLARQPDRSAALAWLAAGGDDYEVICALPPDSVDQAQELARAAGERLTPIGRLSASLGVRATVDGRAVELERLGWVHG